MTAALDVLVVDDVPESVRGLTVFLVQRCRRVDIAGSVREATTAITRRKAAGEPYHLVFSDFVMPEADGLALLRDLRGRQDGTAFVFATAYRSLNPAFEPEARRLDALAVLDKPVDLRRVEDLLGQVAAQLRQKAAAKSADEPFFGTSRILRRSAQPSGAPSAAPSAALEPRQAPVEPLAMPPSAAPPRAGSAGLALEPLRPAALQPRPQAPVAAPPAGYQRRPSGIIPMTSATTRVRRSVDPPAAGGLGGAARTPTPQPVTGFTARVRRGVEGTGVFGRPPPAAAPAGGMYACTACGQSFMAVAKPESYCTVCVHCGALQRIEPG